MAEQDRRPRVSIRFRFNLETGIVEEFLIDDNAPDRSEQYHDQVARSVVDLLARGATIEDAGPRHELTRDRAAVPAAAPVTDERGGRERERPDSSSICNG